MSRRQTKTSAYPRQQAGGEKKRQRSRSASGNGRQTAASLALEPLLRQARENPQAAAGLRPLVTDRLRALQASHGNQYVQGLVDRSLSADSDALESARVPPGAVQRGAKGPAPAGPAKPKSAGPKNMYKVVMGGKVRYLTDAQYKNEVKRVKKNLSGKVGIWRDHLKWRKKNHKRWLKETHSWAGVISDMIGGVVPPSAGIWDIPDIWLRSAGQAIGKDNLKYATKCFANFEKSYKETEKQWRTYLSKTIGGAETAVTTLEITRDVSFAVAGALGGAVLVPAGASLITAGGVSGAVSAGLKGVEEVATQSSEKYHGLRKEFDTGQMFKNMGVSAVTGFVGSVAGGALSNRFMRLCPKYLKSISDEGLKRINKILAEEGVEQVTRASLIPLWQAGGIEVLSNMATKVLTEPAKIVLSAELKGGKPPSIDTVLEKLSAKFWSTEGGIEVVVALAKAGARK